MELKAYLRILYRRWPIVVIVPLLVTVLAVFQELARDPVYATAVRARVIHQSDGKPTDDYEYDDYYNYLSSEFGIDDLVLVLRGNVFAEAVAERMRAAGAEMTTSDIQSALATDRKHRIVTLTVSSVDPGRATLIAEAAGQELEERGSDYLGASDVGSAVSVQVIDRPGDPVPDTDRARLLLLLEVMAAVGVGVLLAFLVDYLDDTLYDGESASTAMGIPHLASVPVER